MLCLGIDLSSSSKRASTLAFVDQRPYLTQLSTFKEYDELLSLLEVHKPGLIAIGAPMGLPAGLHCLEESCRCKPVNHHKGRVSEVELARMGIGCFFTVKSSIIKSLIYRAIEMREALIEGGYRIIEAYPYATKMMVFGSEVPAKAKPESLPFLRDRLPTLVGGLDLYLDRLNHDRCDAVLSAYTAHLHLQNQTQALGVPGEGLVVIPQRRH